ncbi:MAG TPA: PH domain-containing protein [Luteimonas sp.]|nr:PH domain-containing protein [Luteimonas sp.]
MTTPDPAPPPPAVADGAVRRLHPMSWLFVLLQQLRQFVVPLLVLVFLGRGDRNQLWSLVAVGGFVLVAVWRYLTFRYRIAADSVVVDSGVLLRSHRQVPFSRIHNVAIHQSLLHRLFGVAEVRLESAGGEKPEAEMRVLRLDDAVALEALVRRRGGAHAPSIAAATGAEGTTPAGDEVRVLLSLPPAEVLRLGLVSNRGMVVLGAAAVSVSQLNPQLPDELSDRWSRALAAFFGAHHFGVGDYALAALALLLAFAVLLRLFSVLLALLQYWGFRLEEQGRRLTVERGLLTRLRTSAPRRRIQAWTLREGVLHRLFRRRSLDVDSAVAEQRNERRGLRELAPLATPAACDALVRHLLPGAAWPPADWSPLHPRAWWRLALPGAAFSLLLAGALCWRFGGWGLCGLAWLPWAVFVARRHAGRAGYAVDARLVGVRGGWWSRRWRFAEIDKLQALELRRSPLDRRFGMASLWLDTAGAGGSGSLRISFLPLAEAQALRARLAREVARRPLRW